MIRRLVLLGLGDVTTRYVIPGIAELAAVGDLPEDFEIVGVGRDERSTEWLREEAASGLDEFSDVDGGTRDRVIEALTFHQADATDASTLEPICTDGVPALWYFALPAAVFADAIDAMVELDLPEGTRIAIEKPFGEDAESASSLNDRVHRCFDEHEVFRVDHFLALQAARNVVATRFANRIFEPAWGHGHVERVDVVWDETLALEGRAGYYDGTGAARDMLQNHLMQLMCLVAMEPPSSLDHDDLADRKVEVLRATRPWRDDLAVCSVHARYTAGEVDGHEVPAYVDEDDVDPEAKTETFAEITLAIDTDRWRGVPFTLRTGKALADDRHHIAVHFHPSEHQVFGDAGSNVLHLTIEPDRAELDLYRTGGDELGALAPTRWTHNLPDAPLGPYAMFLREALEGTQRFSVRDDEVVAAWRVVDPFLEAWADDRVPLEEYPAGSGGPVNSRATG